MRALVVVAGGSGERLGAAVPKALVRLGERSLLAHALSRLAVAADRVVVVGPASHLDQVRAVTAEWVPQATVVAGGEVRAASVAAGVAALGPLADDDLVAVHDAARALTPRVVLERAFAAVVRDVVAAAPLVPVVDTLKRTDGRGITGTVERTGLGQVQTPQVVRADALAVAHGGAQPRTDDLGMVEAAIERGDLAGRVVAVPGSVLAAKVTHPVDVLVLGALMTRESAILTAEATAEVGA